MSAATATTPRLSPFVTRGSDHCEIDLVIEGARCGGCLAKIENGLSALPGVTTARMNLSTSRLHLEWAGSGETEAARADDFAQVLHDMGFGAGPYAPDAADQARESESKALLLAMAVAGFGLMNIMLLSAGVWAGGESMSALTRSFLHWLSAAIALPIALFSGRPFFRSAWAALSKRQTNMDVPITLAILLACGLSLWETWHSEAHTYFDAALMLIFLLLIGRFLDARLRARTSMAAQQLAALQVRSAARIKADGSVETIPSEDIAPGDRLLIPSGEALPCDAKILQPGARIDAAVVTGETALIRPDIGETIYSGSLNRGQAITVEALRAAGDSLLSDITRLVEAGAQAEARHVRLADRAARAYVPIVHTLALATLLGWLLVGAEPRTAILNAIAVLIITCPCALGLAVPAVQVVAVGRLFSRGILIRSGDALERLAAIRHIVFDKTGTLTQGQAVPDVSHLTPKDRSLIGALATRSAHPISQALAGLAGPHTIEVVEEIPGQGLRGRIDGSPIAIGQAGFVGGAHERDEAGVWAKIGDAAPVFIPLTDPIRPEAPSAIATLHDMGLTTSLLSGDADAVAQSVARDLGIEDAKGRVTPEDKLADITAREASGTPVLMVGDGINDAPALAHAHASASLAGASEISRAAADIILRGDTLAGLPFAIRVARAAKSRVIENFAFAAGYNMLAVPLAVFGHVTPLIAAAAMSGSSLIVTLNALRMRRVGDYEGPDHPGRHYDPQTINPVGQGALA